MIPILGAETRWYCPNCKKEDVTTESRPHTRFHACAKLGLTAPMVRVGTKTKVVAVEREDYIGPDKVQLFNGRPVMAVVTTRDDGEDRAVFAPTATARVGV